MKLDQPRPVKISNKAPTGIVGLDDITGGGLPRGRTSLLLGGPGSSKTIPSLQFLVHGVKACKEPAIFVAFEEAPKRILANAESFGWNLALLHRQKKLFFLDAQPTPDLVQAGNFDLNGMLAVLGAQVRAMKAKRTVFDALDIVLALLPGHVAKPREIYRLHEWLLARELTAPNSVQARNNLAALCRTYLPHQHEIEIVDVLRYPNRALTNGIYITPTLMKLAPALCQIIGTLSHTQTVLDALDVKTATE